MKKVAVIGAGVAGLASAIRLQAKGYEVTIYEKNSRVGGRMNIIQHEGFQFDLGPTIVMMPEIYREVFHVGGVNPDAYIPMEELKTLYALHYPDGEVVQVSAHLEETIRSIESVSEAEAQGYLAYIAQMYKRYLIAKNSFILKSFRTPKDFYRPHVLNEARKLKTFSSAYTSISKFVQSEKLRQLLSFQTLYIGLSPFNGPSIYTIIPMIETVYGVWYMRGGMYTMAQAMERLFYEQGGKIEFNTSVDEVLVEAKKVKGIRIGDVQVEYDIVLSTVDFPHALKEMLPEVVGKGKYRRNNVANLAYSCSCFMLYLGVKGSVPEAAQVHNVIFADDFQGNIEAIFAGDIIDNPSIYLYLPGKIDNTLAPKGSYGLYVLMPVPNLKDGASLDWDDELFVKEIKEKVYRQIEKVEGLENIRANILFEKKFLPKDFSDYVNAQYGATFGLKPTLWQSNYYRPQPKSMKVSGLYFAGSSIHPGAGVPIVLTSAKLAVEEIERDQK